MDTENNSDEAKSLKIPIEDTTVLDCLEVVKSEYSTERSKRSSFEVRIGFVVTILAAICIFVFQQIQIVSIFSEMSSPLTFIKLLRIISGMGIYICVSITLFYTWKVVQVKEYSNFNVAALGESFLGKPRLVGCIELINAYRKIIDNHRQVNENVAKYLNKGLTYVILAIIAIAIYLNI